MMIKFKFANIIKSKLFHGITMLVLAMLTVSGQDMREKELNSSLHLSSEATPPAVAAETDNSELYYALKLKLLTSQTVAVGNNTFPTVLPKGTEVTVTVPASYINNATDISQINLQNVIPQIPYSDLVSQRNEVQIAKLDDRPEFTPFIGESTQLNLGRLHSKKDLKLIGIERDEAPDEAEETAEVEAKTCLPGDPCFRDAYTLANSGEESLLDKFINAGKDLLGKTISSMQDAVNAFIHSDINKKLQAKLKAGFQMRLGKSFNSGRRITVRDGVGSSPYRKCLRGVKEALLQSGVISARSGTAHAKNFGSDLLKEGFINLLDKKYKYTDSIKSPYDAPEGAVLIYSGGRSGHAEIKTSTGFISDYYSKKARTGDASLGLAGDGRRLIGVYIKPTPEINTYLAWESKKGSNI